MSDSEPVEINLDDFEKLMAGKEPVDKVEEVEEVSEQTPSATDESKPEDEAPAEAEGEDGDDTPEEQDEPEAEAKEPKRRKRLTAQERIDELTREKYELRRMLDLERLERNKEPEKVQPSEVPTAQTDPDAPNPNQMGEDGQPVYLLGEFDPKFVADLTKYTFKIEREASKKQEAQERDQERIVTAQQELTKAWEAKVAASAERLPDLSEKFESLQETFKELPQDYGNFLASSIMTLENGPDVLDYFADNLDAAKKLVASGPFEAVIALGRLDQKFDRSAQAVDKGSVIATQAPSPPPKNRGSAVAKTIRADTDNLDDFEKLMASYKD